MFWRKLAPPNPYIQPEKGGVYHLRLCTDRSGDTVRVRFTQSAHIAQNDNGDGGYFFCKPIISSPHLDSAEVLVTFDKRYRVLSATAQGGKLLPVSAWTALDD